VTFNNHFGAVFCHQIWLFLLNFFSRTVNGTGCRNQISFLTDSNFALQLNTVWITYDETENKYGNSWQIAGKQDGIREIPDNNCYVIKSIICDCCLYSNDENYVTWRRNRRKNNAETWFLQNVSATVSFFIGLMPYISFFEEFIY